MSIDEADKAEALRAISERSLRRVAAEFLLRVKPSDAIDEIVERLARKADDDVARMMAFLTATDLRAVAAVLRVDVTGARSRGLLQAVVGEAIRSGGPAPTPSSLKLDWLLEVADRYSRKVAWLSPEGGGDVAAYFLDARFNTEADDVPALRVLETRSYSDVAPGGFDVHCTAAPVVRPGRGQRVPQRPDAIPLFLSFARELPSIDWLLLAGDPDVDSWLRENGWQPGWAYNENFHGRQLVEAYLRAWRKRHALANESVWAQLGGFPITWPETSVAEQLSSNSRLVLRTYRRAEPWFEVFERSAELHAVRRIT